MSTYTIRSVLGPNPWSGDYGPMNGFTLTLEGVDKPVDINQKPTSPAPQPGTTVDLELSPHPRFDDRLKGKKVQPAGGFGGGGSRPEDPKRAATILRQHSQDMALRYAAIRQTQGQLPESFKLPDLFLIADQFDADARAAGQRAAS